MSRVSKILFVAAVAGTVLAGWLGFQRWRTAPQEVVGKVVVVDKDSSVRKLALCQVEIFDAAAAAEWESLVRGELGIMAQNAERLVKELDTSVPKVTQASQRLADQYRTVSERLYSFGSSAANVWAADILISRRRYPGPDLLELRKKESDKMSEAFPSVRSRLRDDADRLVRANDFYRISNELVMPAFAALEKEAAAESRPLHEESSSLETKIERFSWLIDARLAGMFYAPPSNLARVANAITDGDGQFSVHLAPGDYVVLVKYEGPSLGSSEKLRWVVRIKVARDGPTQLVFGNLNPVVSGSLAPFWGPDVGKDLLDQRSIIAGHYNALRKCRDELPSEFVKKWSAQMQKALDQAHTTISR
jgi:hypothetical protein